MDYYKYFKNKGVKLIQLKLIISILFLLIVGCKVKDPLNIDIVLTRNIYIDYDENENQIFTSIALDDNEDISDTLLTAQFTWLEDLIDLIVCIEDDSLFGVVNGITSGIIPKEST